MECILVQALILSSSLMISACADGGESISSEGDVVSVSNFNPSLGIVLAAGFSTIAFIATVAICLKQASINASQSAEEDGHLIRTSNLQAPPSQGLEKSVIDSFPVVSLKFVEGGEECAVCLFELKDDQSFRLLPACKHVFHRGCIDAWLESHVTCPVCRANLRARSSQAGDVVIQVDELDQLQGFRRLLRKSHSTGHSLDRFRSASPENSMREDSGEGNDDGAGGDDVDGLPKEWCMRIGFKGTSHSDEACSENNEGKMVIRDEMNDV